MNRREDKKAFMERGDHPKWIEREVTEKSSKTKERSIWRRAPALAMEAKRMLQVMNKKKEGMTATARSEEEWCCPSKD